MVARLEQLGDELGVGLEVDALDGRIRWETRPLENDELEAIGQRRPARPTSLGRRATLPCTRTSRSIGAILAV